MIPLAQNPVVIVLVGSEGGVQAATNVAPDLEIIVTDNPHEFEELAQGKPYSVAVKKS